MNSTNKSLNRKANASFAKAMDKRDYYAAITFNEQMTVLNSYCLLHPNEDLYRFECFMEATLRDWVELARLNEKYQTADFFKWVKIVSRWAPSFNDINSLLQAKRLRGQIAHVEELPDEF